jgi:hypothetical protein
MRKKSTTFWTRTALVTSFLLLTGLQSAARAETYTYTGNDFESATSPYTTSDFVSGFFTVASPFSDSMALASFTPTSYSFSDGVQTFSSASPPSVTFKVGTDPSGNINAWFISLTSGVNIISTATTPNQEDQGSTSAGSALNFFDQGSWLASAGGGGGSTVPEPGYPVLIGIGFAAIAVVRRRLA